MFAELLEVSRLRCNIFVIFAVLICLISLQVQFFLLKWHGLAKSPWWHLTLCQFLFLLLQEGIDLLVVEIFEVFLQDLPKLLVTFEEKIIRCRNMIMFISVDTFYCVVFLEVVLFQHIKHFHVNWDLREPDEDTTSYLRQSYLVEPGVLADVRNLVPLFRISVQNVSDKVSRFGGYKLWNSLISV